MNHTQNASMQRQMFIVLNINWHINLVTEPMERSTRVYTSRMSKCSIHRHCVPQNLTWH